MHKFLGFITNMSLKAIERAKSALFLVFLPVSAIAELVDFTEICSWPLLYSG